MQAAKPVQQAWDTKVSFRKLDEVTDKKGRERTFTRQITLQTAGFTFYDSNKGSP